MDINVITDLMIRIRLDLLKIEKTSVDIQEIMDEICDELDA